LLAAAGIYPGSKVSYHFRQNGDEKATRQTVGTSNSVCVLNQEGYTLPPTLKAGLYDVFVDLIDGNARHDGVTEHADPNFSPGVPINNWLLGVKLKIRFDDTPETNPYFNDILKIATNGVTAGCGGNNYCPDGSVTREQMAAFIMRALGEFNPPQPPFQRFLDVPPSNPFYAFIDRMAVLGITLGCGGGNYCPTLPVTHEQMAAFIMRALGEFNPPQPPFQRFLDVPPTNPFYNFIDRMGALGVWPGPTCPGGNYCPSSPVTRSEMAYILVRGFNL
jgi:hypothetical protein